MNNDGRRQYLTISIIHLKLFILETEKYIIVILDA